MKRDDSGLAYLAVILLAVVLGLSIPVWRYFNPRTKTLAPPYYLYDDVDFELSEQESK